VFTKDTAAEECAAMEINATDGENMEMPERNPVSSIIFSLIDVKFTGFVKLFCRF